MAETRERNRLDAAGLDLPTSELPRYATTCQEALVLVREFASPRLIHALMLERETLNDAAALRELPEP